MTQQIISITTDKIVAGNMAERLFPQTHTAEPVLQDHPIGHKNVAS